MPSRRRPKSSPQPTPSVAGAGSTAKVDPAEQFAAALKESEQRDRAARERARQQQEAKARHDAEVAAHADALRVARRDLDRAIDDVRAAKRDGKSTVAADATWKVAKARVIELETGAPPAWAPRSASAHDDTVSDDTVSDGV
jgi:hypothetical protein